MNIENYKTFLVLAKIKNFSRTAEQLNIVQSTVSSRIFELEKYLDIKLFKRTNRKIEITEAGKALIPYAQRLVNLEIEGIKNVQSVGAYEDCLRMSIPGSVYRERLSPLIYIYYDLYPQFTVDVRFHKTVVQLEMLMDDSIDIGFISRIPSTNKLIVKPYLEYSWILVSREDYKVSKSIDVSELNSIDLCFNNLNEEYNEWLQDVLPKNFRPRMNMNSTLQLIEHVKKGHGCALLPSYAVREELKSGEFKEIVIDNARPNKFKIYLVINKRRKDSDAVKKFLKLLEESQFSW
ncbi:LysR family transcriptional regulator [Clostridiaceae bacterium M8S5]|nr:LysR family transcriptional regulator [Clostridiaceae bacterium M8S5]